MECAAFIQRYLATLNAKVFIKHGRIKQRTSLEVTKSALRTNPRILKVQHTESTWTGVQRFPQNKHKICGNKMPTRCNRCFYCRSYCFLNMFQAPLCPSSRAREYYTVGCFLWYLVFCVSGLRVPARKPDTQPSAPHHTDKLKNKAPNTTGSNQLYNTLELLMMGIMVPETCWASNKICNKNICCI